MSPLVLVALGVAVLGAIILGGALLGLRRSGARVGLARRLAGAAELRVGELFDLEPLPDRPVRVVGRIRCADPLVTERDERLIAFHRDVEIEVASNRWRSIERLRETRSFELWDHDGSLRLDPADAAEPLVSIPHVWAGSAEELDETFQPAIARLAAETGRPPRRGRATTRMLSVVDRLMVLAVVRRGADGRLLLAPPPGGYVMSGLELDEAMRILGGPHRRWLGLLLGAAAAGTALLAVGLVAASVSALAGA